jgi:hypothetical protein
LVATDAQGRATSAVVSVGPLSQSFKLAADVYKGATFIPVISTVPTASWAKGSQVATDGSIQTAVGGVLSPIWLPPSITERAIIVELQQTQTAPQAHARTPIALAATIAKDAIVTILKTVPTLESYVAGEPLAVRIAGNTQVFQVKGKVAKGATSIEVHPSVAAFTFTAPTATVTAERLENFQRGEPDAVVSGSPVTPGLSEYGLTGAEFTVRLTGARGEYYGTRLRLAK